MASEVTLPELVRLEIRKCNTSFTTLYEIVQKSEIDDAVSASALADEYGRFKVWTSEIEAYRENTVPRIQLQILKLLQDLQNILCHPMLDIAQGKDYRYDKALPQPSAPGIDQTIGGDHFQESLSDSTDSENSSPSIGTGREQLEVTEAFQIIVETISSLNKLSTLIWESPPKEGLPQSALSVALDRSTPNVLREAGTAAKPDSTSGASVPTDPSLKSVLSTSVWGFLHPLDVEGNWSTRRMTLIRRTASPEYMNTTQLTEVETSDKQGLMHMKVNEDTHRTCGYVFGENGEFGVTGQVNNRQFLIYPQILDGKLTAILHVLSSKGVIVNDSIIRLNRSHELRNRDRISVNISGERGNTHVAQFQFRYPPDTSVPLFREQYNITRQLGKGQFGTVFLGEEVSSGRSYAIKQFFRQSKSMDSLTNPIIQSEGIRSEVAALMAVCHPNIISIKELFVENNDSYLVEELAHGGELFNFLIMRGYLSVGETREIFKQLLPAVLYLVRVRSYFTCIFAYHRSQHDLNIVHRDIKPENILLVGDGLHVKLADFTIATVIEPYSYTTTLCGTPSYVAPEILQNSRDRKYTKAVDIWSLGVVLYICFCGFPPFSDELNTPEAPYTLLEQIKDGRYFYPSPYWDSVDDIALDLIDRMLTVDAAKRISAEACQRHPWMTESAVPSKLVDDLVGEHPVQPAVTKEDTQSKNLLQERRMGASAGELVPHETHNNLEKAMPLFRDPGMLNLALDLEKAFVDPAVPRAEDNTTQKARPQDYVAWEPPKSDVDEGYPEE